MKSVLHMTMDELIEDMESQLQQMQQWPEYRPQRRLDALQQIIQSEQEHDNERHQQPEL